MHRNGGLTCTGAAGFCGDHGGSWRRSGCILGGVQGHLAVEPHVVTLKDVMKRERPIVVGVVSVSSSICG